MFDPKVLKKKKREREMEGEESESELSQLTAKTMPYKSDLSKMVANIPKHKSSLLGALKTEYKPSPGLSIKSIPYKSELSQLTAKIPEYKSSLSSAPTYKSVGTLALPSAKMGPSKVALPSAKVEVEVEKKKPKKETTAKLDALLASAAKKDAKKMYKKKGEIIYLKEGGIPASKKDAELLKKLEKAK